MIHNKFQLPQPVEEHFHATGKIKALNIVVAGE